MYEILEHSADEKFKAEADSLEELFEEITKAFSEIVGGDTGEYRHKISVESENMEALLYDFLDELIFLQDANGVVISHAKELNIEEKKESWKLDAQILVDTVSPNKNPMHVKSPTYNEMEITYKQGTGWTAQAVLDV